MQANYQIPCGGSSSVKVLLQIKQQVSLWKGTLTATGQAVFSDPGMTSFVRK
jgi:hypothetical protein